MAICFGRVLFRNVKCLAATVIAAFFVQIVLAVIFFPSVNDNLLNKSGYVSSRKHEIEEVSARKMSPGLLDDEDLPVDSKKNSKKAGSVLRLEELDFRPICDNINREAISAIHRAKSQNCKQEILNKTCLIHFGQFYPDNLPNNCVGTAMTYGKLLGCFVDEKKMRLLSNFYGNYATSNSPTFCLDICVQAGFPYAGVQYGSECFCGEASPPLSSQITDDMCDMKCPGDYSKICGGYFTMNIYETGLMRFVPKTPNTLNSEKKPIRIVFLLTLNGRAIRQVHRLINSLYRSSHYFYIHVDARQDYLHRKLSVLEDKFPNIKLASTRFSTIWGGASLLTMLLSAMKDTFNLGWQWDFVINLSESDFPIKSLESLELFLSANKGLNFVKSHGREVQRFIKKQGLDKTFVECETHMWRIGERKLPKGIVIDGGSDWIALSSDFVQYVTGKPDQLLAGLNTIFKHTLLPAESFFHTVLRNSRFCTTYVDNNLHVTNWKRKLGCKCQYKHVVDWCGCSPNVFRTEDWPRIQSTFDRQLFFARKFEPIVSQEIITRVEQFIGYSDHLSISSLEAYWQSIYNNDDLTASTDDVILSHAGSIIRHHAKILLSEECIIHPGEIIEINTYHNADVYKGNLILHKVFLPNDMDVLIETWYKPIKQIDKNYEHQFFDKVKIFKVSSDYDQKENIFRNFANILGPLSEPVLLYEFNSPIEKTFENMTIMWLDPGGVIADIDIIHVDENNLTSFVKPNLKAPLLPGIWKVGLFRRSDLIASTKFLITPLEYFLGKEISHREANIIHSGSQNAYKNFSNFKPQNFLPDHLESLQKMSYANVQRINKDLREWIDSLSIDFYNVLNSCISLKTEPKEKITCGKYTFQFCATTEWSSLSPDPKGTIGKQNNISGKLER